MWSILEKIASFLLGDVGRILIETILLILIARYFVVAVVVTAICGHKGFICVDCGERFFIKWYRLFWRILIRGIPRRAKKGELRVPRLISTMDVQCPKCGLWNCGMNANRK